MRIRALRWQKQMTLSELAKKLGVSYVAVQKWETGENTPRAARLPQIAEIFGVTINELYEKE